MDARTGKRDGEGLLYIWFDTEYSSLRIEEARLLQVAALVTDTSLKRVLPEENDLNLTVRLPDKEKVSDWVQNNLSELVNKCRSSSAVSLKEVDRRLATLVDTAAGEASEREKDRPVLAGNSVHMDWWLIRRYLPCFRNRLNYRLLDVTSFKLEWKRLCSNNEFDKDNSELIARYFPEALLSPAGTRHDAYYDIQASIAELNFYRRYLLKHSADR